MNISLKIIFAEKKTLSNIHQKKSSFIIIVFYFKGILIQIRSEIMSDGKARLDHNPNRPYDEQEAKVAFQRMVRKYGWDK